MVVREDRGLAEVSTDLRNFGLMTDLWRLAGPLEGGVEVEEAYSTSGREPNSLFYNLAGEDFVDLSAVSGVDSRADGRVLARLDYDRDGFTDLAVTNANAPRLELLRNRVGETAAGRRSHFLAVRLVGGQEPGSKSAGWSPRDACGARVEIAAGGRRQVVELRCGEGFAAQNSATLHIGLGEADVVDDLRVVWPSGRTTVVASARLPPVDHRITLSEREDAARVERYRP